MKILYITTLSTTVNAFLIPHIKMLINQGHHVDLAFNIEQNVNHELLQMGCKVYRVPFNRSPFHINNYKSYSLLKKIININKYDLVHTHTPVASSIARLACRKRKDTVVFYTAHGFHFFRGAPIKNWLLYFPIEKWLSRYTDVLITINREDNERAKKYMKAKNIEYMPGVGIDTKKIMELTVDRKQKREELNLPQDSFIMLSVGELNRNKNHETIIKALSKIGNNKIHYIICGNGILEDYLINLIKQLELESHVHLLGFRSDIIEICKSSDVFVFPSKREGLGLSALEAMTCGLPIITSDIHGIVDYSVNGITGYTSKPNDVDGFAKSIQRLQNNDDFRRNIGIENKKRVRPYDINCVLNCLNGIYTKYLND